MGVNCVTGNDREPTVQSVVQTAAPAPRPFDAVVGVATGSAPERVAAVLRAAVLEGELVPGQRLREHALCERFGAGRHTVRAALHLLVESRLVVHERNRGAFVRPLTLARIDEAFGFRRVIELGSLSLALARGADLSAVEIAVQELESVAEDASWRLLMQVHGHVHHEIVRAGGNDRLLAAYSGCEDELKMLVATGRPDVSPQRLARLHRHLVQQLHLGGDTALQALEEDLEVNGRAAVLQALQRHGGRGGGSPGHLGPVPTAGVR